MRIEINGFGRIVGAPMVNVRRVTLDAILLDAAAAAGAEVRTADRGDGTDPERRAAWSGWTRPTANCGRRWSSAPTAPARPSPDLVGARKYHETPPGRLFVWTYLEGVASETDRVRLGKIGDHVFLASPTDSGLFMVALGISMSRRDEVRARSRGGMRQRAWPAGPSFRRPWLARTASGRSR